MNFDPWWLNSIGCAQDSRDFSCWILTTPSYDTGGHCITISPTDKIWTTTLNYDPTCTVLYFCRDFSFSYRIFIPLFLASVCTFLQFEQTGISMSRKLDGSQFHVVLWPRVMIQRRIVNAGNDKTQDSNPGSWFNVDLWPRVMILCWIVTLCHNPTFHCDPKSWF